MEAVIGSNLGDVPLTHDHLPKMEYLDAFIKECMRCWVIADLGWREVSSDWYLKGKLIPKGTQVFTVVKDMHHDPELFKESHIFKPERWLADCGDHAKHNRHANIAFGAGARFCPGRHLAIVECKMVLTMFIRNFRFEGTLSTLPKEVFEFTMMPELDALRFYPVKASSIE